MSIISEIKCGKCDRMYSGIRSRCPYCGTRRIGRGKHSDEADNSKGKMLIAVLIMGVLVVATGVLLFTTEVPDVDEPFMSSEEPGDESEEPVNGDEGNYTLDGTNPVLVIDDGEDPSGPGEDDLGTPMSVEVQSVTVRYGRGALIGSPDAPEFTLRMSEGNITLNVSIEPVGVQDIPQWASSSMSIFEVTPLAPDGIEANVRAIGRGTATLTITVGDYKQEVTVRIT